MRECGTCEGRSAGTAVDEGRRWFVGRCLPALAAAAVAVTAPLDALEGAVVLAMDSQDDGRGERRFPLPAADGVIVDRQSPVILVRRGRQVIAFSRSCPHEQADLRWREADQRFQCPRHESKFQADGTLIGGRAKRAMDRLPIRRDGSAVIVNLATPIRADRQNREWSEAVLAV